MSPVYAEYISTAIVTYRYFRFLRRKCTYSYCLLIVNRFVVFFSLFPDLLCNIGLSVSGLRKMRFNAYTPCRISTKNRFPKKPGFPLFTLIILDWYSYVSLFPYLLCNIGLSVSGLRKIRFNAYTSVEFPQKISSQRNQDSRCPR